MSIDRFDDGSEALAPGSAPTPSPALGVRRLSKSFSGVKALKEIDLDCPSGQVTALLGPNGCGKSTLVKVLAGYHAPDPGAHVTLHGRPVQLPAKPEEIFRRGLRFVHQDLALVDEMSVADNLALARRFDGREPVRPISRTHDENRARRQLEQIGADVDPGTAVRELGRTEQILVALARVFDPEDGVPAEEKLLVLDEPTALLSSDTVDRVLAAIRRIQEHGGTLVYVTHRLDEVEEIADYVVVLRDGNVVESAPLAGRDARQLGESVSGQAARSHGARAVRPDAGDGTGAMLRLVNLSGSRIRELSLSVQRGEILGIAGLAGCGRSELARLIAGVQPRSAGSVWVGDRELSLSGPADALAHGVAFVPPNRKAHGGVGEFSAQHNLSLSRLDEFFKGLILRPGLERRSALELMERYGVRPPQPSLPFDHFSGGNQQKLVIAKFARLRPQVFVVDEPTQGVDVMGKVEIFDVLRGLASEGCAVVLASSDLDEVAHLCARVAVLDRGHLVGIYAGDEIDEHHLARMS